MGDALDPRELDKKVALLREEMNTMQANLDSTLNAFRTDLERFRTDMERLRTDAEERATTAQWRMFTTVAIATGIIIAAMKLPW